MRQKHGHRGGFLTLVSYPPRVARKTFFCSPGDGLGILSLTGVRVRVRKLPSALRAVLCHYVPCPNLQAGT